MTAFILKTVKIRSYEVGLYFRDDEFKGLLGTGRHWFCDPLGKVRVEVVSQRDPWLVHEKLDMIVSAGNRAAHPLRPDVQEAAPARATEGPGCRRETDV